MARLTGQVAVVTGASSGVGRSAALALAKEGANVAVVARRKELLDELAGEIRGLGVEALSCPTDIADPVAVESVAKMVVERFARVDILVNNAGITTPKRMLSDITVEGWQLTIDVNLNGVFYCARAFLPTMRAQNGGTIVTVASFAGVRPSLLGGPAYSAAKTGVISLNESINLAERKNGIRACVICPGEINTPILKRRPVPLTDDELATMLLPEDVADAIVYVVTQPQRATVEQMIIRPTVLRANYTRNR